MVLKVSSDWCNGGVFVDYHIFCAIFVVDGEVFFILTGDFCFSIASRVSSLEVAKQTPLCTLDFVCRVQLMYDVWPDFLSGDTEWT